MSGQAPSKWKVPEKVIKGMNCEKVGDENVNQ